MADDPQVRALLASRLRSDPPVCVECRIHAARIGDERAARYYPPLGTTIALPASTGGTVHACVYCTKLPTENGPRSLQELGIVNRAAVRAQLKRKGLRLNV